ncbi:hypothetical protein GGX14DRAFT_629663 [Mycena pura]|uniref:PX domain-containing protein n=1 Tax=Mycena pura TaxID=153505 RepID=A0AAD6YRS9_9AGAR|nr:hypothetical protein GGX14DRAFT_629663 [Mycena pura]
MNGLEDGPTSPESWKRAVYRAAPSLFTVEMLPPVKLGGKYNFRMRICPIFRSDRSSVSSRSSNTEYEVLRRWEDCLIFQDTLEREYGRLAMAKRQRLLAGKGVRKNGVYLHSDMASSWESLPAGPEPDSVAKSVHDLIPRLSKKATVFRASQATIDQRQAELTAFIVALWKEDVPTLLEDFRKERMVTDFFGFWRRDQDIEKKNALNKAPTSPRSSVTSSVFSSYFSAAGDPRDDVTRRARALSSASSDSSSVASSQSARSSLNVQITFDDHQPLAFGHNPHHAAERLEPLQESPEAVEKFSHQRLMAAVAKKLPRGQPPRPDSRASNAATINRGDRESWMTTASGMSFINDLNLTLPDEREEEEEEDRCSRMSMASIATFRTEISSEGVMPRYYIPERNPARLSTASFMTDVSADAIIPASFRRSDSRATVSGSPDTSPFSDDESDFDNSIYDAFPRPCSFIPTTTQNCRPETPVGHTQEPTSNALVHTPTSSSETPLPSSPSLASPLASPMSNSPVSERKAAIAMARPPSPNPSVVSASLSVMSDASIQSSFSDLSTITPSVYSFRSARSYLSTTTAASLSPPAPLVIKAAHKDSIILLRVDGDLSLCEIQQRLRDKFLKQEGISLSDAFTLAYMIPGTPATKSAKSRGLSDSLSAADAAHVEMVSTEYDWARLRSSLDNGKLTLRVMDAAASA